MAEDDEKLFSCSVQQLKWEHNKPVTIFVLSLRFTFVTLNLLELQSIACKVVPIARQFILTNEFFLPDESYI